MQILFRENTNPLAMIHRMGDSNSHIALFRAGVLLYFS